MKALTEERDLFGNVIEKKAGGKLEERFLVPPFSVLDARQGYWQDRKREWVSMGVCGVTCGTDDATPGMMSEKSNFLGHPETTGDLTFYKQKRETEKELGHTLTTEEFRDSEYYKPAEGQVNSGSSFFDPVLCELIYRWFCPPAGRILDPFAGESTKGIVATYLGYQYTGIELRAEQVAANQRQAEKIGVAPAWICADSSKLEEATWLEDDFDLIFTSPPYYDLEIYSRSEKDGSAFETYPKFMAWYRDIFAQAIARLKDNRFLVVKVGEIRDERGFYRNFLGDNIRCFLDLGLHYYNEAVLVTAVGSLPVRIGRQFAGYRKVGKTHQNILVFYKGNDPKRIKEEFGTMDISAEEGRGDAGNPVSS